jgi:prepilin-type N-terminal cleavage/methylation domain-containing protein
MSFGALEMPNSNRDRGFTLIEVMVVISIIALLAALLEPVILSSKRSALKGACQSNLRQIGLAINMYGADNNDFYPSAADQYWIDHADNWSIPDSVELADLPNLFDVLQFYAGSPTIYRCPSDALPEMRVIGETKAGTYPSQFAYDRSSYHFFVPDFFGKSQTRYPSSLFLLARDFDPRWHCAFTAPQLTTPAYNFLHGDGHVRFDSLWNAGKGMVTALASP